MPERNLLLEAYKAKNGGYPADLTLLTADPNKFLRQQTGLAATTLTNASGGYVVTYDPATGGVTSNMTGC